MTSTLTQPYAVTEAHPQGQATGHGGDWRHQAACRPELGVDPEIFFPTAQVGDLHDRQVAEAKKVCFRCPAATDCLTWALETGQNSGVAGGMSEDERHDMRRRGYGKRI